MRQRLLLLAGVAAIGVVISLAMHTVAGQSSTTPGEAPTTAVKTSSAPTTPWGEPDLQGIWSRDEQDQKAPPTGK